MAWRKYTDEELATMPCNIKDETIDKAVKALAESGLIEKIMGEPKTDKNKN